MSVEEILAYVADRGCEVVYEPPDRLRLRGPGEAKTEALLGLLRSYREEILAHFGGEQTPEEQQTPLLPDKEYLVRGKVVATAEPGQAECWRYRGESRWLPCEDWTPFGA